MHDLETIKAINANPQGYRASLEQDDEQTASPKRKPTADLHKWIISGRGYTAGNSGGGFMYAAGDITNDEAGRFINGTPVRTSSIVRINLQTMQIETLNTIYNLK